MGTRRKRATVGGATLPRQRVAPRRAAYDKMIKETESPGLASIERLIVGMGYTWHDWAEALEQVQRGSAPGTVHEARVRYGKSRRADSAYGPPAKTAVSTASLQRVVQCEVAKQLHEIRTQLTALQAAVAKKRR